MKLCSSQPRGTRVRQHLLSSALEVVVLLEMMRSVDSVCQIHFYFLLLITFIQLVELYKNKVFQRRAPGEVCQKTRTIQPGM